MPVGFICISQRRMPEPSTWNTPAVSPLPKQVIGGGIIGGDVIQVEVDPVALADQVAGACHDGKGRQPEEVHLEQAE